MKQMNQHLSLMAPITIALIKGGKASLNLSSSAYGTLRITYDVDGEHVIGTVESWDEAALFANDGARRFILSFMREVWNCEQTAVTVAKETAVHFNVLEYLPILTKWAEELVSVKEVLNESARFSEMV